MKSKGGASMNVVICEDEQHWHDYIQMSLSRWANARKTELHCDCFFTANDLIRHLAVLPADVVLLDIALGQNETDGMTAAKHLRKAGNTVPIIFITSNERKAADGYLVEAMGFLSKPIDEKRLAFFLDRIVKKKEADRIIKIVKESGVAKVRQSEILFVEVNNHSIVFHTMQEEILTRGTLSEIISTLGDEDFVQIHRAYVIAKDKIHSIKTSYPHSVRLVYGAKTVDLPVSRNYISKLLHVYSDDVLEKMI